MVNDVEMDFLDEFLYLNDAKHKDFNLSGWAPDDLPLSELEEHEDH